MRNFHQSLEKSAHKLTNFFGQKNLWRGKGLTSLFNNGLVNVKIPKNHQLRDHLWRPPGTARPRVSPEMNELE